MTLHVTARQFLDSAESTLARHALVNIGIYTAKAITPFLAPFCSLFLILGRAHMEKWRTTIVPTHDSSRG